ncbi:MAG: excinuclease ABC subunit UvrC [bacterium]|nr:excinuclease ABC subunit UvrC [bacterium]MDY4109246.1 excinuclease ABC subunit UvrC [Bacilli bacterium]
MLKEKLLLLPNKPGCYLMKDKNGVIIYVGKAKNLKNRVNSYFKSSHTGKTKVLVSNIVDFEYIITNSELEALLLEINLIKEHNPKYNVLLKDDKSYPYIEITDEKVPRLLIVRPSKLRKKNHKLYGPYPNSTAAKKTIELLNRLYPLRKCKTMGKRECLYYHIGECLGYCCNKIDKQEIDSMVSEITRFLKGEDKIVLDKIDAMMESAISKLNFEKAKELNELKEFVNVTLRKQLIDLNDNIDRDIFGYAVYKGYIGIQVLFLRGGKLIERNSSIYPIITDEIEDLTLFISSFYDKNNIKPKEILIPDIIDDALIKDVLNINVIKPAKGKKKELVEMANKNALNTLKEKFELVKANDENALNACCELKDLLGISSANRIETFDNSHLFGTYTVSGMVVFTLGVPDKNNYRKYKILSDAKDDYHLMKEVIYRRYFRVLMDNLERPDLIIVDGGKAQINAAEEVLNSLNLDIPVCGLIKSEHHKTSSLLYNERIYDIDKTSNLFHMLERLQDEVHNYTISYHKNIRSKGALSSVLDNVPGIGEVRKRELLKKFPSVTKMKEASVSDLEVVLPSDIAKNLYEFLKNN